MDGLEAVELKLQQLRALDKKFRIDSYFFSKQYFVIDNLLRKYEVVNLGDILANLTDYHANGSYEILKNHVAISDSKDYAYMVRTSDLEANDFVNNVKYVSEHAYNFLTKSKVYGGEILINKIGSAGKSYLMPYLNRPVSLGMNLFLLRLNKDYESEFVYSYLQTKYGELLIKREVSGAVPLSIDKSSVRNIIIPKLSSNFQYDIKKLFSLANQKLDQSKRLYQEAEQLLLEELGLANFKPSDENISIRKLSDSFGAFGRLDSEYYQPKYNNIAEHIKLGNHKVLSNIVHIRKSIEPGSDAYCEEGIEFIRVSNISKFGITKSDICLPVDFLPETEYNTLKPKPGTILLSKDGSVGIAYRIKNKMECITSGALLHLNIKDECLDKIMPEYLTLVLNSVLVQMQAERDAGGSIIQHWKPSEIEQILIPCLDIQHQCLIEDKIKSSFQLKEQSQQLLDLAKHAIELAIEQNETASVNYITNHISKEFA